MNGGTRDRLQSTNQSASTAKNVKASSIFLRRSTSDLFPPAMISSKSKPCTPSHAPYTLITEQQLTQYSPDDESPACSR